MLDPIHPCLSISDVVTFHFHQNILFWFYAFVTWNFSRGPLNRIGIARGLLLVLWMIFTPSLAVAYFAL